MFTIVFDGNSWDKSDNENDIKKRSRKQYRLITVRNIQYEYALYNYVRNTNYTIKMSEQFNIESSRVYVLLLSFK